MGVMTNERRKPTNVWNLRVQIERGSMDIQTRKSLPVVGSTVKREADCGRHRRAGLVAISELTLMGTVLALAYWGMSSLVSCSSEDVAASAATARACSDHPVYRLWMDSAEDRLWVLRPSTDISRYKWKTAEIDDVRHSPGAVLAMVAQSPDGTVSLQLTRDSTIHLDAAQCDPVWIDQCESELAIVDLAVSQQGALALVAYSNGSVLGWSLTGPQAKPFEYRLSEKRVVRMCLDGAGRSVFAAFKDGTASFHDARTGEQLPGSLTLDGECTSAVWSSDGLRIALATSKGIVSLFELSSRQPIWKAKLALTSELCRVTSLAMSVDGRWIAATGMSNRFLVWDVTSDDVTRRLSGHDGIVRTVAFSRSTPSVISGGLDGTIREWSLESFTQIKKLD